jgi:hypothetical protein
MPLFTAEQLNRFSTQAEEMFVNEFNCVLDRLALTIASGSSLYVLPDYIINIRRITYKGIKLEPISHRDLREYLNYPTATGTPEYYVFNNVGQMTIKLFPTPVEDREPAGVNLLDPEVIRESCIVEFYSSTDGIGYRVPEYFRRRLLKAYVLKQAFLAEGKGQNIIGSVYWRNKWERLKEIYGTTVMENLNSPRKLVDLSGDHRRKFLAPPVLPYRMRGTGVDLGE